MTSGYLLDTNVLSETRKVQPDTNVTAFLAALHADSLFVSVLTLGELRKGIEMKRRSDQLAADRLTDWVIGIETTFADHVLPINAAAARLWGEMSAIRTLPVIDALIAATALAHKLTFVTRNTQDVEGVGVALLDPFKSLSKS
jgi:predicted nucleic acid-binding protein